MTAYRDQVASQPRHDQWQDWAGVRCPVLLMHGLQSDALLTGTIAGMRRTLHRRAALTVAHIPETGHTPLLSDRNQIHCIGSWLQGQVSCEELSIPLAHPREAWPGCWQSPR